MPQEVTQLKIDQPTEAVFDDSDIGAFRPKILDLALRQFEEAHRFWHPIYKVSHRDKSFLQTKQWDAKTMAERAKVGKVSASAPLIGSYFRQKMGQLLPGTIDINVKNVDPRPDEGIDINNQGKNDEATTSVLSGAIRFINRNSNAKAHRITARKEQCSGGIGWLSVGFKDSPGVTDGEIVIKSPKITSAIYVDPHPEQPDFSDAAYGFELFNFTWAELRAKYGKKVDVIRKKNTDGGNFTINTSFTDFSIFHEELQSTIDQSLKASHFWVNRDRKEVTVAVWHNRVQTTETYYKLTNGVELKKREYLKLLEQAEIAGQPVELKDSRKELGWKVERRVITQWTVLEEDLDYFIDEIPHVPVPGYAVNNDGETTFHSIIHDGVDLQEHINLLKSQSIEKSMNAKAVAVVPHGVTADKITVLFRKNNIDFIGVDPTAGGVFDGKGTGIQVLQNPDNGAAELQQISIHMAMLQQTLGIDSDRSGGNINSAAQLQLALEQELVIFQELDENFKIALTSLYRKVLKGIVNTYSSEDLIRTIDQTSEEERIVSQTIPGDVGGIKYDLDLSISPSSQIQRRNEQVFLELLSNPVDPILRTAVIPDLINSSPVPQKDKTLMNWGRSMFVAGQADALPPFLRDKVIEEMQESGQLSQMIQQLAQQQAQQIAQQQVSELVQDGAVQASLARSQADIASAQSRAAIAQTSVDKATITADKDIRQDILQVEQQTQQTAQDILRTEQERINLQQELIRLQGIIANADSKQVDLASKQIDHLNRVLEQADTITVSVTDV